MWRCECGRRDCGDRKRPPLLWPHSKANARGDEKQTRIRSFSPPIASAIDSSGHFDDEDKRRRRRRWQQPQLIAAQRAAHNLCLSIYSLISARAAAASHSKRGASQRLLS